MRDVLENLYALTEPLLEGTDVFIVSIKIKPTNNIKLFLDADSGLSIDKCTRVNRKLYALLEESAIFPDGDFSLEVSSPGVDEPLQNLRQYKKNIGRHVLVTQLDGKETLGVMKEADEVKLTLEVKLPKNKGVQTEEIPLANIKETVVQIIF